MLRHWKLKLAVLPATTPRTPCTVLLWPLPFDALICLSHCTENFVLHWPADLQTADTALQAGRPGTTHHNRHRLFSRHHTIIPDLVSIVLLCIVRGGDHHPGSTAQQGHASCHKRCRDKVSWQGNLPPSADQAQTPPPHTTWSEMWTAAAGPAKQNKHATSFSVASWAVQ